MLDIVYAESIEHAFEEWKRGRILCTAYLSSESRSVLKAMIRNEGIELRRNTDITYQL